MSVSIKGSETARCLVPGAAPSRDQASADIFAVTGPV